MLWVNVFLVDSCASKTSFSSQSFIKILDFQNLGGLNLFNYDLGNSVVLPEISIKKLLDFEVFSSMIEQNDTDFSSIIFVDDSSTNINRVFPGKTRSGSDSAISVGWDHPAEASLDHGFTSGRDDHFFRGTNIITSSKGGSLFGYDCVFVEFLNKKFADFLTHFVSLWFHNFPPN